MQSLRWWTWGVVYADQVYSALLWPTHSLFIYYIIFVHSLLRENFDKVNEGEKNRWTSVYLVYFVFFIGPAAAAAAAFKRRRLLYSCINYSPCNHQFLIFANNNTFILLKHTILNTIINNVIHSVWPWARVKLIYFLRVSNLWILYLDFETDVLFRSIIFIYLILLWWSSVVCVYET